MGGAQTFRIGAAFAGCNLAVAVLGGLVFGKQWGVRKPKDEVEDAAATKAA